VNCRLLVHSVQKAPDPHCSLHGAPPPGFILDSSPQGQGLGAGTGGKKRTQLGFLSWLFLQSAGGGGTAGNEREDEGGGWGTGTRGFARLRWAECVPLKLTY
jgi:hypothetical protein